ncbi:hypothetical protein CYMTET_10381 [Cymbomonas tetramitiformis]|uniref:Uncharacterized protein n=1 Tax=Cymbomonas tetramitiformis TaxID=36881 RepID=A0AAE0GPQ5_9CHLO|nr:hypothetical protein CYMTET_10381 [Cymbomonas tetramitiformis]
MMHVSSAHEISPVREPGPGSSHITSPCADPRDIVRSRSSGCLKEKRALFLDRAHMESEDIWLRSGPDSPASPLPEFSDVDELDFAEQCDCDFDSALPQDWPPLGTPASLYSDQIYETNDKDGRRGSLDPVSLIAALSRHAVLETPEPGGAAAQVFAFFTRAYESNVFSGRSQQFVNSEGHSLRGLLFGKVANYVLRNTSNLTGDE